MNIIRKNLVLSFQYKLYIPRNRRSYIKIYKSLLRPSKTWKKNWSEHLHISRKNYSMIYFYARDLANKKKRIKYFPFSIYICIWNTLVFYRFLFSHTWKPEAFPLSYTFKFYWVTNSHSHRTFLAYKCNKNIIIIRRIFQINYLRARFQVKSEC